MLTENVIAKSLRPDERSRRSTSNEDFTNGKLQPGASDAEATFLFTECLFSSENNAGRAPMHIHRTYFQLLDSD